MRRLRLILALGVLCGALVLPSAAFARVSEYQVQYNVRSAGGAGQLIVNVVLSQETTLPATVQVPLPAGATVVWSGEIVGDDPTADPFREAVVTAVDGGLVATFTLEQVGVAQVEADLPAPTASGNDISSVLNWVNTGEEGPYTFAVVLETGAGDAKISPAPVGEPTRNEAGETLYTLTPVRLAGGQEFAISVRYSTGGGGGGGGSTTSTTLIIVAVLLSIALVALLVVLRVQRVAARPHAEGAPSVASAQARPEGRGTGPAERSAGASERQSEPVMERPDDDFFTFD